MRSVPMLLMVLLCAEIVTAAPARSEVGPCRPAELFATDNTDVITDSAAGQLQDGLTLFELQADATIAQNGAAVTGSTLLDGVYWSNSLQRSTFERSREFHLCSAEETTLHTAAEALRRQFNQEAVLTFDYLPRGAPDGNAVAITVPDVDVARFRDAFNADAAAHNRLQGGSVTAGDHTLILIADNGDLDVARRLVSAAGGNWNAAGIAYGKREFVD